VIDPITSTATILPSSSRQRLQPTTYVALPRQVPWLLEQWNELLGEDLQLGTPGPRLASSVPNRVTVRAERIILVEDSGNKYRAARCPVGA